MKIINRIYEYLDFKGIKPTPFEKKIMVSSGYLKKMLDRNADIGETVIINITEYCPDINILWLITGKGNMISQLDKKVDEKTMDNVASHDNTSLLLEYIKDKDKKIEDLMEEKAELKIELEMYKKSFAQMEENATCANARMKVTG